MIKSVGCDEVVGGRNGLCCDTCNGLDCLGSQLRFEARSVNKKTVSNGRKRPCAKKKSDQSIAQLKSALLLERTSYIARHPGFLVLGP